MRIDTPQPATAELLGAALNPTHGACTDQYAHGTPESGSDDSAAYGQLTCAPSRLGRFSCPGATL
jgi:hypothetical protein